MTPAAAAVDAAHALRYGLEPVTATFTGVHAHDGALPDWSPAGLAAAADAWRATDAALASAVPAAVWEAMDVELLRGHAAIRLAEDSGAHGAHGVRANPSLWAGEAVFGLVSLMLRRYAPAVERAESLHARLTAVPGFLAAAESTLVGPLPAAWVARARRECDGARRLLDEGIALWLTESAIADPLADAVRAGAVAARAAFDRFDAWIAGRAVGAAPVSCGAAHFDLLLLRGHQCRRTRDDLLADAKQRFAEAKAALAAAASAGFGSWAAVEERLAAAHPNVDGFLAAFEQTWAQCFRKAELAGVVTWPGTSEWPLRYTFQPAWAQGVAPFLYFLHYRSPAAFDAVAAHEYLVPPIDRTAPDRHLQAWNHAAIKLNHVVHHGAIGHHVQNWHAYRRSPSRVGQVAAIDAASRIAMFCGGSMAEGWACYATALMDELGFLTPLERMSERHSQLRFLARAITDISLHDGRMTFDDAVRFWTEEVGMSDAVGRNEATKVSMFPGSGLMYWLGLQGIRDLRAACARRAGAGFSLRLFHDELLSHGSMPVPMVARHMLGEGA
ncbi:MAG: DUF885 family protein [Gemmatimonadota bacterium]|nr:DUF885 family protein [Gemmatimonadota bacterium]